MNATLVHSYSTSTVIELRLDDGRLLMLEAPRGRFAGMAGLRGIAVIATGGFPPDHFMELVAFYPDADGAPRRLSIDYFPPTRR